MALGDPNDLKYLRRALRLALRGRYRTAPNPRVGAVLVRDGKIVAEGWHREVGGPHAEVEALRAAARVSPEAARGATLYVTLEPCSHFGRTPPCADAVIAAGVARVLACVGDPNPKVAGRGFARLRQAGIEVELPPVATLGAEAVRINLPFFVSQVLGRPAVTLKWAMSLDGKIATVAGESRWISSPEARKAALGLREEHDAILVGVGTVLADDPRLDRRVGRAKGPILRVVLDRRLRTPSSAQMLQIPGPVVIFTESDDPAKNAPLGTAGAEVVRLPAVEPGAVLAALFERGVRSVLVEGGGEVHASFVAAGLYDAVQVDAAPVLLGGSAAPTPLGGTGFARLDAAPRLERVEVSRRGEDVILSGLRAGCLDELLRAT
ncbi:MAG TPA: bifunctional diaminohydroxyphosphoribosylaminopyrimidine deaminase/5-amino-6-(5-phosphoribosylamino)uracil reductase RibD [Thermoanaerobaculia bacterium]|nr:bifunctional diaminohydroxyphosphoribosylaminopyrimidine deaminase/5-amino-6-(5-phosphoribosylamino)uracil reductase RibD [Thermoanaerobaculia bacterium]